MKYFRKDSLDKVEMSQWNWDWFLDQIILYLSSFAPKPYPIPKKFLSKQENFGRNNNVQIAKICTWACSTKKIRQARAACVEAGKRASVLNFVITPNSYYDLPFFGADFVTLPSGHLLALDLQPALKNDIDHTNNVWKGLIPIHKKWQSLLPSGGSIPNEAEPFFSPGFLWSRLPLGEEGERLIRDVLQPAFIDYLKFYIDLINTADKVDALRSNKILQGQRSYMNFRAKKDPARGMLESFYGKEWTEEYINSVLFDLE